MADALTPIPGATLPRDGTTKPPEVPTAQVQVPGEPPEQWRDEFKKTIEQRDTFKKQYQAQQEELKKLQAFQTEIIEKDKAAKERLENEKLLADGKFQELRAKEQAAHQAEREAYKTKVAAALIPEKIQSLAARIPNLTKEALVDLPKLLKDNVALDDETMAVVVLDDQGNPMKDENGLPVKVEDYIQNFVSTRPYLLVDVMPKKHGAINSSTGHAPTSQNPMSLEEEKAFAEKDPEGYKAWVADQWSPAKMIAAARAKYGPNRPIPHA